MDNQLTIRLPKEMAKKLKKLEKRLGIKRSDMVRLAINHFFQLLKKDENDTSLPQKLLPILDSAHDQDDEVDDDLDEAPKSVRGV